MNDIEFLSIYIYLGFGLFVIVIRISKFFSNSGCWWIFEYMEENLRIYEDGVLQSAEILIM